MKITSGLFRFKSKKYPKNIFSVFEDPIRSEIFSAAHLERHGETLAAAQPVSRDPTRGKDLSSRVAENGRVLLASYNLLAQAIKEQRAITPAAEWLIDNFHIVEDQIRDIHDHLPPEFYQELPKLSDGPLIGYPRVYGIAWAFVAHTDSLFDPELLKRFVKSYQKVQPLTIGELWAVSITLRVVMVENLRRLSARIVGSQIARKDADKIADELLGFGGQAPLPSEEILKDLTENPVRGAFAVQLVQRLRFQDPRVAPVLKWLDERLAAHDLSADEIVPVEHSSQTAANVTVRNIITSMRLMSAFDWQTFFEEISLVDETLRNHPGYGAMDFITRDRYRHGLEELAKGSPLSELEVAKAVVTKCFTVRDEILQKVPKVDDDRFWDPGYYLISRGRPQFETEVGFKLSAGRKLLRRYIAHASETYVIGIILLSIFILCIPLFQSWHNGIGKNILILLGILGAFPAAEIAITIMQRITLAILGPRHLPRLRLAEGIPANLRTFVVVPTLLLHEDEIEEQIDQLEVHHLSNPEGDVHFALLSDWRDWASENSPDDSKLLEVAVRKVASLNSKYGYAPDGTDRFFIFHRRRLWNDSEGKWIGWERKRGKLHEFNRLLRGAQDTSYISTGGKPLVVPAGIKYVITLDADTKLPRGAVSQLVGTFAHPLNRARFDKKLKRVVEGYGVLQPRITPSLPAMRDSTVFQRVSSGPCGIDPYASAVSDVYQDLFGEGSYTGKGIYEVDIFEQSLKDQIPENSLLSHDLFEGNFARCGLLSDVEFFEDFPSNSEVAAARMHRWTRGDWQLLPWILGRGGRSISVLGRWKMFDNLRRSLTTPMTFFTILASFCVPDLAPGTWVSLALLSLSLPTLLPFGLGFVPRRRKISTRRHLVSISHDLILGLGRFSANLILLAHHSWVLLDAISRALFRLLVSRRKMLEWTTAAQAKSMASLSLRSFIFRMAGGISLTVLCGLLIVHFNVSALAAAGPFIILWILSPVLARQISLPPRKDLVKPLADEDVLILRLTARRIWRFFSTFVTLDENYLPPDNFQVDPNPIIAHRSSPTNFGLYLLSIVSARDFGWIGIQEMVERLEATLGSMKNLPRFHGHFFNWYETTDCRALEPKYISSVDNGNLAGHLIAVAQSCEETLRKPVFSKESIKGIQDGLWLLRKSIADLPDDKRTLTLDQGQLLLAARDLEKVLFTPIDSVTDIIAHWDLIESSAETLVDIVRTFAGERDEGEDSEILAWAKLIRSDVESHLRDFSLVPWAAFTGKQSPDNETDENKTLWSKIEAKLSLSVPLGDLPSHCETLVKELVDLKRSHKPSQGNPLPIFVDSLMECLESSIFSCKAINQKLKEKAQISYQLFNEMDFRLLYDSTRKLFSIGYRVADNALDSSYYDLLASEARLTSFIAIAKGDIPASHWFRLGRALAPVKKGAALISWSGSMFEYLMPSLVMYTPAGSLLEQTCRLVIQRQIQYGIERDVPWGVSESAYNTRDLHLTYQYSNFGVPDLGLKRSLGEELVITPYATVLAAMYYPAMAVENLKRLSTAGAEGIFGYYEAVDFTSSRLPGGQTAAVVKTYMAHHQGMSLVAIANVLYHGVMRHRFHSEPIVQAAELLLQERTPRNVVVSRSRGETLQIGHSNTEGIHPTSRKYHSPSHPVPTTHLLSNGHYAVMLTAAGSGFSRFRDLAVTRWREDVTRDPWGSYIFLRDTESGDLWSTGYQPTCVEADRYEAVFAEDRARITREDGDISSDLEIIVSSEDNAEMRRLTLTNTGSQVREIEVTSYAEVVLATQASDVAHPAFSNLFVQTEYLPEISALIATRRTRSHKEVPVWMAHVIAIEGSTSSGIEYETDRGRFIGRGRSVRNPVSVVDGKPLSNTVGSVLDPVVSLRTRIRLEPGSTRHITFSTIIASTREEITHLADKFRDASTFERVSTLAWTQAQVQLHYLGIEHDEANLFQQLANRVLYSDSSLRPSSDVLKKNSKDVSGLWAHGISGDYPIVLVKIDDLEDRGIIRQLLRAHEYWGTKRLVVDLVILNEKSTSYVQDLQVSLEAIVRASTVTSGSYRPQSKGKIFIMRADLISQEDRDLLQTAARAILLGRQGSLAEQVKRMRRKSEKTLGPLRRISPSAHFDHPSLPVPHLEFFNGLGGFANQGREYVTFLGKGQRTPAPWINVIANSEFGFHVSERGAGYTWALNSRENQITPWSNDPVCDPSGEALYICDIDTGFLWSPTASPIRIENATYIAHHGQGYSRFEHLSHGIYSELAQFVSWDDPLKISKLVLENRSKVSRRLSVTSYVEWVLGFSRTVSSPYIITEYDEKSGGVFAYNPWNSEYGKRVSFVAFVNGSKSWTGDRAEFMGRNGNMERPSSLLEGEALSGRVGAGLDPCAAIQTEIELSPGGRVEICVFLGQAESRERAQQIIEQYRTRSVKDVLAQVIREWDKILNKIQVETPDKAMNLMLNRWLLYQTLVCRFWARAAFYQAGGAYGFRDQLQDVMALAVTQPELARTHILRAAARQFIEGDVQHWWHPPFGRGVRTRVSDDLLWLPFSVSHYLNVSLDLSVLDQDVSFIQGAALLPEQEDSYYTPEISKTTASLYEHCARTLDRSLLVGRHGLPLMGAGDWNDGMNLVGHEGKGESVWLAWFLYTNLMQFSKVAVARGEQDRADKWTAHAQILKNSVEKEAWDGAWYRRAYFDDGTPLGSASNAECRIDSIAQTWGILSGAAAPERALRAMESVEEFLIRPGDDLLLLFAPPFDKTPSDPGYIKGYLPGVRENGGQYSHAAIWCILAYATLGNGQRAVELFSMLNPVNHSLSRAGAHRYKVEPYVIAADVYSEPPYVGRGGWTWYTGSSGWMYRAGIEFILGVRVIGNYLSINPRIHPDWDGFKLHYRHGNSDYEVVVKNPRRLSTGIAKIELDGKRLESADLMIPLSSDGIKHLVVVTLGSTI